MPDDETRKALFLRAEHSFDAKTLTGHAALNSLSATCLSFLAGDLVFLHLAHTSGWADVTLVRTYERGWVPKEYFTTLKDQRPSALLMACGSFLAQPRSHRLPGPHPQYTFSESAINSIISGTKLLLDELNTLSRDSELVQREPRVAQARKAVLTELAHLVHVAKHHTKSTSQDVIGKLIRGVYRLIERTQSLLLACDLSNNANFGNMSSMSNRLSITTGMGYQLGGITASNHNGASTVGSTPVSNLGNGSISNSNSNSNAGANNNNNNSNNNNSSRPGTPGTPATPRPRSFIDHVNVPDPEQRLHEVCSAFVAYLQQFINPADLLTDSDNESVSNEILGLTRRCMLACRELLIVLDVHPTAFEEMKDDLLESIRRLAGCARHVVNLSKPEETTSRMLAVQNLVHVAEKCYDLCIKSGQACLILLKSNPDLGLPQNRAYPVFPEYPEVLNDGLTHSALSVGSQSVTNAQTVQTFQNVRTQSQGGQSIQSTQSVLSAQSVNSARSAQNTLVVNTSSQVLQSSSSVSTPTQSPTRNHSRRSSLSPPKTPRTPRTPHSRSKSIEPGLILSPTRISKGKTYDVRTYETASSQVALNSADDGLDTQAISEMGLSPSRRTASMPQNAPDVSLLNLEDELVFRNNSIRGGTFKALVAYICGAMKQWTASEFEVRAFLLCFRLFSSPANFVAALFMARDAPNVAHVAQVWRSRFWCPEDDGVSKDVELLANGPDSECDQDNDHDSSAGSDAPNLNVGPTASMRLSITTTNSTISKSIPRATPQFFLDEMTEQKYTNMSSAPIEWIQLPRQSSVNLLLSTESSVLAEQLTLSWFDIFAKINAFELIDQRFSRQNNQSNGLAPNVQELVQNSNMLSAFIGDTMLSESVGANNRSDVLTKWLEIAHKMFVLGNLNGSVTITLTLSSDRIYNLTHTWSQISEESKEIYAKLRPFTLPDRNFGEYRKELRLRAKSEKPCIPFLGIVLGDLVLIDEGNPKLIELRAINFDRYLKTSKVIAGIQAFQTRSFGLIADLPLQAALAAEMAQSHRREIDDEDEQWRRSQLIRKRESGL